MDQRARRSPARFLAPLALIAVIVALMAIINGNGNSNSSGSGSSSATTASTTTPAATTTKKKSSSKKHKTTTSTGTGPKTYTVQVGDTLGAIAAKTGVPLSKIQELNPDVDPHTMNAGQQIRLR